MHSNPLQRLCRSDSGIARAHTFLASVALTPHEPSCCRHAHRPTKRSPPAATYRLSDTTISLAARSAQFSRHDFERILELPAQANETQLPLTKRHTDEVLAYSCPQHGPPRGETKDVADAVKTPKWGAPWALDLIGNLARKW